MERIPSGSRDDLLSQFAHDLRTPLTAIRSFSEILVDNPDLPDSERNRFLSVVLEESERLHRHIERVLDFSGQGTAETKERGQVSMTNNGTKYPGISTSGSCAVPTDTPGRYFRRPYRICCAMPTRKAARAMRAMQSGLGGLPASRIRGARA